MASESRRRRTSEVQYIYHLPYFERKELCRILDVNSKWEILAGLHMHYTTLDIQELKQQEKIGNSPTDQLLNCWGSRNHTILELFILLYKIKHHQAMMILKPFVEPKYHSLLYEGEESITRMLQSKLNNAEADSTRMEGAAGPFPSAPSPSSVQDKTLGFSKRNINNANQAGAVAGPSYKAGISELLHPQIKIQNSAKPFSDEMNIDEISPDGHHAQGNAFEHTPGPSGAVEPCTSVLRRLSSPTGVAVASPVASPVLLIPAPNFPGSQSPKPEGDRENVSPSLSRSPSQASNIEGRSPTARRRSSCESRHSPCEDDIPHISYKELDIATGGWDKNNILGRGGFGTVFKGLWKHTEVAVKRLELQRGESAVNQEVQRQQSLREMRILRSSPHDNILPLYGYSMGGDQPCLVYKYMANGSLEDRLLCRGNTPVLNWVQRLNIATGTARGLQFLHTKDTPPLIHGDIKSANILLDSSMEPRIGDFGLAREGPQSSQYTHVKVSRVHGTRPYLPDDFLRHKKLSTKVDTYSFGVVLFELATGLRAFDDNRPHKYLKDLVERTPDDPEEQIKQLRDKRLALNSDLFLALLAIGKICTNKAAKDRPEMALVLTELSNRMKTYEMRKEAHDSVRNPLMHSNHPFQQATQQSPIQKQEYYDLISKRSSVNTPRSPGGSVSPVIGCVNSVQHPTGGVPVGGAPVGHLVSGLPIFNSHHHPSVHQGGFSPGMAANLGSHVISQDAQPPPALVPLQNMYPSPPQLSVQRWQIRNDRALRFESKDGVPPHYPESHNPAIAVMPPTCSANFPSTAESYYDTEAGVYSHATSLAGPPAEIETDNTNAGNIPLLSVLGINQNSDGDEHSEQLSSTDTSSSNGSISNNIDKSTSQTSNTNNNVSSANAITVRSCRSNSGPNVESVLPNLKSLTISPGTQ